MEKLQEEKAMLAQRAEQEPEKHLLILAALSQLNVKISTLKSLVRHIKGEDQSDKELVEGFNLPLSDFLINAPDLIKNGTEKMAESITELNSLLF